MSVAAPSLTVYVKLALPAKLAAGVNVTVPAASVTVPLVAPLTAVTVSAPPSTSVSLAVSDAPVIASAVSSVVLRVSSTATGGSFTAVTAIVTRPVSVAAPSLTV